MLEHEITSLLANWLGRENDALEISDTPLYEDLKLAKTWLRREFTWQIRT